MFCKCHKSRKCYPLKSWRIIRYKYTPHGFSRLKCLKGVIELKPKEYEPEQLKVKFEKETKPTKKTKKVKRSIEFNDPSPVLTPINSVPEVVDDTSTNVKALLGENDF